MVHSTHPCAHWIWILWGEALLRIPVTQLSHLPLLSKRQFAGLLGMSI